MDKKVEWFYILFRFDTRYVRKYARIKAYDKDDALKIACFLYGRYSVYDCLNENAFNRKHYNLYGFSKLEEVDDLYKDVKNLESEKKSGSKKGG